MADPIMLSTSGFKPVERSTVVNEGYPIKLSTLPESVRKEIHRTAKKVREDLSVVPYAKLLPYFKITYHYPDSVLYAIDRKSKPGKSLILTFFSNKIGDATIYVGWEEGKTIKAISSKFSNNTPEFNDALHATILALNKDRFHLPKRSGKNLSSARYDTKRIKRMAAEILKKNKCPKEADEVMTTPLKEGGDLVDCVVKRKEAKQTKTFTNFFK